MNKVIFIYPTPSKTLFGGCMKTVCVFHFFRNKVELSFLHVFYCIKTHPAFISCLLCISSDVRDSEIRLHTSYNLILALICWFFPPVNTSSGCLMTFCLVQPTPCQMGRCLRLFAVYKKFSNQRRGIYTHKESSLSMTIKVWLLSTRKGQRIIKNFVPYVLIS